MHLHLLFGQYSLHDQFRGGVSDGGEYFRFDIAEDFDRANEKRNVEYRNMKKKIASNQKASKRRVE